MLKPDRHHTPPARTRIDHRHPRWALIGGLASLLAAACSDPDDDAGAGDDGGADSTGGGADADGARFSFFVASLAAMQRLSGSQAGFGGDLRFGKADGLSGADEICRQIAEASLPGSGVKGWRAFLSVTKGPDGQPIHAVDRVGEGPWYDRRGRLIALTKADLIDVRPKGAEPLIAYDLPNEDGVPNHAPDGVLVDNHDTLTGSDRNGRLYSMDWGYTCHDWTSAVGSDGKPRVGHSWTRVGGVGSEPPMMRGPGAPDGGGPFMGGPDLPDGGLRPPPDDGGGGFRCMMPGGVDGGAAPDDGGPPDGPVRCTTAPGQQGGPEGPGDSWISSLNEAGCAPGVDLVEKGPPDPRNPTVGSGGGYGGIYCLALTP
jgi:hypothetical protein